MTRAMVIGCLAASMLSACTGSGSLHTNSSDSTAGSGDGGNGNNSQGGGNTGGSTPTPVQNIDMRGYVDGGEYDSVKIVDLDKTTGDLLLTVPIGLDTSISLAGLNINQLPGVTLNTVTGSDGRTYVQFRVPLKYVLRGVNSLPSNKLPNGDPLPLMPAGEYPSVALQINTNNAQVRNIALYIGVDAIGVYIESPWVSCYGSPICVSRVTVPLKNSAGTKINAYFSLIMPKGQSMGGFFVSTVMPTDIARILDEYFIH